ncbi:hypothetical protein FRC11_004297, partial [Ceratobasidium sp. 423]
NLTTWLLDLKAIETMEMNDTNADSGKPKSTSRTPKLSFLNLGILCMDRALDFSPESYEDSATGLLNRMALLYLGRYRHTRALDDICTAVECHARAVSLGYPESENMANSLYQVLLILRHQYQRQGDLDHLDGSIECAYWIVSLTHGGHKDLPDRLIRLGHCFIARSQKLSDKEDINLAIEYIGQAVKLTPGGGPDISGRLTDLSNSYFCRFLLSVNPSDLNEAIEILTYAVLLTPNEGPTLSSRLAGLSRYHEIRFTRQEELEDLEKAVEYSTHALDMFPNAREVAAHLPNLFGALGANLLIRFHKLGQLGDIDKAVEYGTRAVTLAPENHKLLPMWLNKLGNSHKDRFLRSGEVEDVNKAIHYQVRAAELTPEQHLDLPIWLSDLGICHMCRFERLGEPNDINKAIEYTARAVDISPADHKDLPALLNALGAAYRVRFVRFGTVDDINKAVENQARAVKLTFEGDLNIPARLNELGNSYESRFRRLGELKDADKAIEYLARAIDFTPEEHPDLAARLCDLGIAYDLRFERLGVLDDIHKAVEFNSRGVMLTPDGHTYLPARLNGLGKSYRSRYERLDNLKDIDKAIEFHARAVALTPKGHAYLGSRLQSLGHSHVARGLRLTQLIDIEKALACFSRDIELTPEDHPNFPDSLSNLGNCHDHRFSLLGEPEDITKAIEFKVRAVALTPEGHAHLPGQLTNLAESYMHYFLSSQNQEYLASAVDCFQKASKCLTGHPRTILRSARRWGQVAAEYSVSDPIEAYQTALDLVPRLVWLGSTIDKRYEDLHGIKGLAVEAAAAAIDSRNYDLALEWLEQSRSVVWNQTLQLRTPLDRLRSAHPDLTERLQRVAGRLHGEEPDTQLAPAPSSNRLSLEQAAQQQRRNAEEYDMLISEVRRIPGFENFLKPRKLPQLARAAKDGPIVTINCQQRRCDALVLLPGSNRVRHIALPEFSGEKAMATRSQVESALGRLGIRERGFRKKMPPGIDEKDEFGSALAALWTGIAEPVLDFLGYRQETPSENLPHVTWCLTGALSFLPIHAAGNYEQPQVKVPDFVVSSYTPTLGALISSREVVMVPSAGILVVGQESTPGHSPLPGTSNELAHIKRHINEYSHFTYTELVDKKATPEDVLAAMESHAWVHLACHAHQNLENPSESGVFLHGGTLNLAAIRRKHFKNNGLAFLSACQTATGDKDLPDEAVHLASGMLTAGYPSVIATMWSVMDADAPFVADKVYGELLKGGKMRRGNVAEALHKATAALRDMVGPKNFPRWVPYIHVGS